MTPRALVCRAAARPDAGSLSLEVTFLAPGLLLMLLFLVAAGRFTDVSGALDAGVRDAARAATQARSLTEAQQRAQRVLADAVGTASQRCRDTLAVEPIATFRPGGAVTVNASCRYPLADLGLPGVPGELTVRGTFASPLDPNREVR
ncbi:TadE/TadG family type IV pilus assembly protein [Kineococcus sp. NUM-3379]